MVTIKKVLKKILFYLLLSLIVVVAATSIATFLYKDQLINRFIQEANKSINTPIHIDKISVSSWRNFPRVSLTFQDVLVEESYTNSTYPLLQAEQIDFTFNPLGLFRGNYTIEQVHVKNGRCHLKMNEKGIVNYAIFKESNAGSKGVKFDLSKITLHGVLFTYSNVSREVNFQAFTENTTARLSVTGKQYDIVSDGDVDFNYLMVENKTWVQDKALTLQARLHYDDDSKHLSFDKTVINIFEAGFNVSGSYDFKDRQYLNLTLRGKDTNIQTLLAILPQKNAEELQKYKSKGEVYFDMTLDGEISNTTSPAAKINFGLRNAELFHPDNEVRLSDANMTGIFSASSITDLATATLTLSDITGRLENHSFKANLSMRNLSHPFVKLNFEGEIDAHSLFRFYKAPAITTSSGGIVANVSFEGHVADLEKKGASSRVKTSGEIRLQNLSLEVKNLGLPLKNLEGNLLFNNNDLALSDVSGMLGKSDFALNGFFKNVISYLLFDDEPVGIESDLRSDFIDIDELLAANTGQSGNASAYSFSISPRLALRFNCSVKKAKFRRFTGMNIKGDVRVQNQIAISDKIQLNAMGGTITLSGRVDAAKSNLVGVETNFNLNNINVDSIFYVFENFNQNFLEDRHLKGRIMADVMAEMTFNDQLTLLPETLVSNLTTSIKDGELNNFEPMRQLSKYLDEGKLDKLRFSELKNEIHIENQTIYLPEMEISSNVTNLKISGTHTFDQRIHYRVVTPLNSRKKVDKDEAFGAIEEDGQGRSMLYLMIVGTTSDYKVIYDKEGVKKKIVSDLKKEVQELKDAFKNKGQETNKKVELEEDEYFEWDDN